ncbi:hypothetical protein KR222_010134, partial [Zaprionus bogoriensis]
AAEKLRRFCYLGAIEEPVYTPTTFDLTVECHFAALRDLCAEVSETELVSCLSSLLDAGNAEHLPRRDEALLVLAIDLSTRSNEKQRNYVRANFGRCVSDDKDLFVLTRFVRSVQKLMERKTPFSRTVRKAILEWYSAQPLDRLLHMWSNHECDLAMHRDLLQRCHYSSAKLDAEVLAVLRLLSTPNRELVKWPEYLNPVLKCRDNILGIVKLRLAQTAAVALPIVKQLALSFEHVPRNMMHDPELVNVLLPSMSYEQLLQTWPSFLGLYKPYRGGQSDYTQLFFEESKLRDANVQPIRLLLQQTRLQKHRRVVSAMRHDKYSAMYNALAPQISKGVVTAAPPCFMHELYKRSFGLNKPLGVRLHITLNVELCYLAKSLTGRWRSVQYLDAVVALAFGYFRSDAQVNVQYWHDKSGQLKRLPWTHEMTADEAKSCCESQKASHTLCRSPNWTLSHISLALQVAKIKQTLTDVIESALKDAASTYDLFLVIVPCGTRGNPKNNSDELCRRLDEYRQKRNANAKFILLSLRQHHASMAYSKQRNEHMLELCSISEQTPRLIAAFAHDKFF